MTTTPSPKQELLTQWLKAHVPGNSALLFASLAPYEFTPEAVTLLQRPTPLGIDSLYVMFVPAPSGEPTPLYIGRAAAPWKRWSTGHLRGLRRAQAGSTGRLYDRWSALLATLPPPSLLCVHEGQILFPPLPDFPTTIGAVEYQLVSLADDAYPGLLLNREGAAR